MKHTLVVHSLLLKIDPEVASGIDSNPYPRPFSIQVGLSLNF